jgi:hypothetical protein
VAQRSAEAAGRNFVSRQMFLFLILKQRNNQKYKGKGGRCYLYWLLAIVIAAK